MKLFTDYYGNENNTLWQEGRAWEQTCKENAELNSRRLIRVTEEEHRNKISYKRGAVKTALRQTDEPMLKPPPAWVMEAGGGVDHGRPWLPGGKWIFYCKGRKKTTERVDDDYLLVGIVWLEFSNEYSGDCVQTGFAETKMNQRSSWKTRTS